MGGCSVGSRSCRELSALRMCLPEGLAPPVNRFDLPVHEQTRVARPHMGEPVRCAAPGYGWGGNPWVRQVLDD
eukprot:4558594-Alexandrium_andersonii.AAC.1